MGRNDEELEHDTNEEMLTLKQSFRAKALILLQKKMMKSKRDKRVKSAPKKSEPRPAGIIRKLLLGKDENVPPDENSSFCGLDGRVWDSEDEGD